MTTRAFRTKSLQISLNKGLDENGQMRCSHAFSPIKCSRLSLDSYSIVTSRPTLTAEEQRQHRATSVEDILIDISWLDHGVTCGTIARGISGFDTPLYNNAFHLTDNGMCSLQSTGGIEMYTKTGFIPSQFTVEMFQYTGHTMGGGDPGYSNSEAVEAYSSFDSNGGPIPYDTYITYTPFTKANAYNAIHTTHLPYVRYKSDSRINVRVVLNFTIIE